MKLLAVFLLITSCAVNTDDGKPFKLSELTFESIIGVRTTDSQHVYLPLASGFFRTPRSENSDSMMTDWLIKHPGAMVVPVSTSGPIGTNEPDSKMTYCWIIDGADTINNYLVRNGCFPGGTMMIYTPPADLLEEAGSSFTATLHIDSTIYNGFLDQIRSAEIYARQHALGIWGETKK